MGTSYYSAVRHHKPETLNRHALVKSAVVQTHLSYVPFRRTLPSRSVSVQAGPINASIVRSRGAAGAVLPGYPCKSEREFPMQQDCLPGLLSYPEKAIILADNEMFIRALSELGLNAAVVDSTEPLPAQSLVFSFPTP